MLERVVLGMVNEEKGTGGISQVHEITVSLAYSDLDRRFDRRVKVVLPIRLTEIDIIVVNLADSNADLVVNAAGSGRLLMGRNFLKRWLR